MVTILMMSAKIAKDCLDKYGYNFDDVSKSGYARPP